VVVAGLPTICELGLLLLSTRANLSGCQERFSLKFGYMRSSRQKEAASAS